MKKTLTVNLNNTVYHIDEDAYSQLQDYLESLKDYFRNEEGADEILSDIEARIAELFKERMRFGMQIITVREVDEVVTIMGHPEDFASDSLNIEEDGAGTQNTESSDPGTPPDPPVPEEPVVKPRRRLFRDRDDAFLGGVASGLGYYTGVSVVLIRILFVLFTFITGYGLLVYLILWICIPEAKTAAQKLEMRGEPVTIDNIKRFVTETISREEQVSGGKSFGDSVLSVFRAILKAIFMLFGGCLGFILLIVLFALIVSLLALTGGTFSFMMQGIDPVFVALLGSVHYPWMVISVLIVLLGIPVYALFRLILGRMFNFSPQPRWLTVTLVVVWIIAVIAFMTIGILSVPEIHTVLQNYHRF